MAKKKKKDTGAIAVNRRARFDYEIIEEIEAGLALLGSEVKSLRTGAGVSITEAYAGPKDGEFVLFNVNIPEYKFANMQNHAPKRMRKLLLHKKEIAKLTGAVSRDRMTIVPIKMYFNNRGLAKILLGLARGKKQTDKRETIKERDWQRQKSRVMKNTARDD